MYVPFICNPGSTKADQIEEKQNYRSSHFKSIHSSL